ncbi:cation:proton antiporter [Campylobacter sp. JMF_02 ED1]|uniref:cation:proton antiporter domain-containing protein n=1 Tax=unclassified Campylobacter TaxID=2593542 RepID=UPI0022E9CB46|nr:MULTISPECIES: cation:proton antiporter [unclassified Campylobacter]MDA3049382.1 cation:proton antiporter [Campylobacter sp. JMF_15 NE4]MDA3051190.1 cation:proton antiporter [Campylobacter sp. JMF_02 ED1]
MDFAIELFLTITALAIVLNIVFKVFEIPSIIGYIVAGVCFTQIYSLTRDESMYMSQIAEFGVVFLMFSIGLEFSFKHLMSMKKDVFFNGFLQVAGTGLILTLIIDQVLSENIKTAIIIGLALSLSSTAIVLKSLNDSGEINRNHGRKVLGILLFQDLAVIPILLMIDIFASTDSTPVNELVLRTAISAAIVIISLFLIGKFLLNTLLGYVTKLNSKEIFIATVLFVVIGASFLAHVFGFSYTLGAFIAGMLIAETEYKREIAAGMSSLRDILLGLFFITIGIQIKFDIIANHYGVILLGIIIIMALKAGIVYAILILSTHKRIALKSALSLAQIGEFALAIFALLISKNLINKENAQILIAIVVATMILTPFILKNLNRIANRFESNVEKLEDEVHKVKISPMKNHFVIVGYGRVGQEILLRLRDNGLPYIVAESDLELVDLGKSRGENVHFANMMQKSVIDEFSLRQASVIILTLTNQEKLDIVTNMLNKENLSAKIIVMYSGPYRKVELEGEFGENFIFMKEERMLAGSLLQEALRQKLQS